MICLPLWSVEECRVDKRVHVQKSSTTSKPLMSATFWLSDNGLNHFFACWSETATSGSGSEAIAPGGDKKVKVEVGYSLRSEDLGPLLHGEWGCEKHCNRLPSLRWAKCSLNHLLDHESSRSRVLTDSMFLTLTNYLRSSTSAGPLNAVPLMIKMLRLTRKDDEVTLDLGKIRSFCKVILIQAMTMSQDKKVSGSGASC